MRNAFRIGLQSFFVLCFVASAGLKAEAGLGPSGWLAAATSMAHPDTTQDRQPAVAAHPGTIELDAAPCAKVERPAPAKHQCHRATTQVPVSSRPRPQDDQDSANPAGYRGWLTFGTEPVAAIVVARFEPRGAARRSAFWQIFAYAVRLRR